MSKTDSTITRGTCGPPIGRTSAIHIEWTAPGLLLRAWRDLGGPEPKWANKTSGRARAFWRDGDGLNIALDRERNTWFDHAHGTGGGVCRLVEVVLGCDARTASRWLAQRYGATGTFDARGYREREQLLKYAALWMVARTRSLERIKVQSLELRSSTRDIQAHLIAFDVWSSAARELYDCQRLTGDELLEHFREAVLRDPDGTVELVRDEQCYIADCRKLAGFIVGGLARAASQEAVHVA